MLSILLPVYNFDVRLLVKTLHSQCTREGIAFEIICLDDRSEPQWQALNREIAEYDDVLYEELKTNAGRSAIRNLLVRKAAYPYLLFLDCDSGIIRSDFIQKYVQHLATDRILYGGRRYGVAEPAPKDLYLHWHFGVKREALPVEIRQRAPYDRFMTNNFVVPKQIMERIPFEERLRQYGHEDTLFGYELRRAGIPVMHLDNPVEHLGLETAETFLTKTRKSVENLVLVHQMAPQLETSLLKWGKRLRFFAPPAGISDRLIRWIRRRLLTKKTGLFWLDVYKLMVFLRIFK